MYKIPLIALLLFAISSQAQHKLFLDFTVDNKESLKQLDEALKIGTELRTALKTLDKNHNASDYEKLKNKLEIYEAEMLKVYGIYPGLTYRMIPTSGYIFQLLPVTKRDEYIEKGFKVPINAPVTIIKNKASQDIECFKVKIKLLQKRDSVMQFNQSLMTADSLRKQIRDLEEQLKDKPQIRDKEEIQKGMKDLKEALTAIESKMNERFGIQSNAKYTFEPKSGAVYLALSKEDLKKLSDLKKARNK